MRQDSFNSFRSRIKNSGKKKKHRVTNSYGTYDYYKYYRKNRPKDKKYVLTESQYFAIVRKVNQYLADELVDTGMVDLLSKMGTIEIRKFSIEPKIGEDGELIFHAPIDWDKTLRLWYEDEEAHKNKTLIKVENREVFKRFYNKLRANYKNKSFYDFLLNKNIKTNINKKAKKGRMDAFEFNRRV